MVKDKKARIRVPCPFTDWVLYLPPEATFTAKVDCVLLNYGDDVILNARLPNTACRCKKPLHEVEAKKRRLWLLQVILVFFFSS